MIKIDYHMRCDVCQREEQGSYYRQQWEMVAWYPLDHKALFNPQPDKWYDGGSCICGQCMVEASNAFVNKLKDIHGEHQPTPTVA